MFWGLTPALDLLQEIEVNSEKLNILVIGGVDCRHVLKTLARRYRHKKVELNFCLVEVCIETIAKQLLLLNIALQPSKVLGLVQKSRIFMELYGNSLIRPFVAKYLTSTATELVKMVTDYDYFQQVMPNISLEIKYKERDYMENLFKFWCCTDNFDICKYWDERLRKFLGVRYDSKIGAFDWDLNMRFHTMIGANRVCNQEYRNFRQNGLAFSWLESEVSRPNRSMVCVVMDNGNKFAHYGYLGDMQTGPFVTYGLDCEDEKYLKSSNGQSAFRSTDITERNLNQLFFELLNQEEYHHETSSHLMGQLVMQMPEKLVIDNKINEKSRVKIEKCPKLEDVTIQFLSASIMKLNKFKEKYKNKFNLIYIAGNHTKFINQELVKEVSDNNCLLLIENQRYVLRFRNSDLEEYENEIKDFVKGLETKEIKVNLLKDDYFKFVLQK